MKKKFLALGLVVAGLIIGSSFADNSMDNQYLSYTISILDTHLNNLESSVVYHLHIIEPANID